MSKILTIVPLVAIAATNGLAADLPRRMASPVFVEPAKAFDWTGGYAGVSLGPDSARTPILNHSVGVPTDHTTEVLNALKLDRLHAKEVGIAGGGQIGYNYQFSPGSGLVAGLELDAQYIGLVKRRVSGSDRSWIDIKDPDKTYTESAIGLTRTTLDFIGTVRGRVGYGFDRVLLYGTAGLAYGAPRSRGAVADTYRWSSVVGGSTGETTVGSVQSQRFITGYAYGGGLEYAIPAESFLNFFGANAVVMRAEYLHYEFGSHTVGTSANELVDPKLKPAGTATKIKYEGDIFRAGIHYRFGVF